jgi:hypothetical protein
MTALPPVPATLKVALKGFVDGLDKNVWANILHFGYTGSQPGSVALGQMANTIGNNWDTHMGPECPSQVQLQEVQVTDLTSASAGQGSFITTIAGKRGDDSIPANAAVLISYAVSTRYRGGHPRQYLLAGGNADLQGATEWSTLFRAEVEAHWTAFLNSIIGVSAGPATLNTFCAVSYYSGKDPITGKPARRAVPLVLVLNASQPHAALGMASQRGRIGRRKK